MRKKTFLKAVSIFACFSILMLSVPGAIASERTPKKNDRMVTRYIAKFTTLLPFLNLRVNHERGDISSDLTSAEDSGQKVKITGTLSLVKGPRDGDK